MSISDFSSNLGATLKSCVKMVCLSRPTSIRRNGDTRPLVIMGNGPSLRKVLDDRPEMLSTSALMSVNFAANAPEFFELFADSLLIHWNISFFDKFHVSCNLNISLRFRFVNTFCEIIFKNFTFCVDNVHAS